MKRSIVVGIVLILTCPGQVNGAVLLDDRPALDGSSEKEFPSPKLLPLAALYQLKQGNTAKAIEESKKFLKEHPTSVEGYIALGTAALAANDYDMAEQALQEALRLEPERTATMALMAQLFNERGESARAEDWSRKALARSSELGVAHRSLAAALLQLGRVEEAAREASMSFNLSKGRDPVSQFLLARIKYEQGKDEQAELLLTKVLAAAPGSQDAQILLGIVKLGLNKVDEASRLFSDVATRDRNSSWLALGIGITLRLQGQLDKSQSLLTEITVKQPQWALPLMQLGETRLAQGDVAAALTTLTKAAELSPDPDAARLHVAGILLRHGLIDQAIAVTGPLRASSTHAASARTLLANLYAIKGEPALAERELQDMLTADPQDAASFLTLGRFYLDQHRPKEAFAQFKAAAAISPKSAEIPAALAEAYAALGEGKAARQAAQEAISARSGDPTAAVFLCMVDERLGDATQAEACYQEILKQHPDQVGPARALALLEARTNRTADALHRLDALATANKDLVPPLIDIALIQEQAGHPEQATASYRSALDRNGYHPVALNNLAFLLSKNPATLEEAFTLAQRAARVSPGNPQIADTNGWICFLRGDGKQAEQYLTKAVQLAPRDPQIHYRLGLIYQQQGKRDLARAELQRALESPFAEADQARVVLNSL